MFVYIIWGIIILAIALSFKRLASGVVMFGLLLAVVFFVTFVLDSGSDFPLRQYIPLNWFDETVEDPEGKARDVGEGFKDAGEDVAGKIDETGKKLDIKYGVDSKEWVEVEEEEREKHESNDKEDKEQGEKEEKGNKKETKQEDVKKGSKKEDNNKKDKEKKLSKKEIFIKYEEVKEVLEDDLSALSDTDKELIRTMTNIYKTEFEGEDIVVWNTGDKGKEGMYVKYK